MQVYIQKGSLEDIDQLLDIAESHLFDFKESGYITRLIDKEQFTKFVLDDDKYLFVIKSDTGEVLGYTTLISEVWSSLELDYFTFHSNEYKKSFHSENSLFFNQTAIKKGYQRLGLAKKLHQYTFNEFPNSSFITSTLKMPYENKALISLKESLGFVIAAEYIAKEGEPYYERYSPFQRYHGVLMLRLHKQSSK